MNDGDSSDPPRHRESILLIYDHQTGKERMVINYIRKELKRNDQVKIIIENLDRFQPTREENISACFIVVSVLSLGRVLCKFVYLAIIISSQFQFFLHCFGKQKHIVWQKYSRNTNMHFSYWF